MSMPESARLVFVGQAHLARAAAEQRLERLAEILVDALEGLGELLARYHVDIRDGLLGIADGIQQILPLHAQEFLALRGFLEFFHAPARSPGPAPRCARALLRIAARPRRWLRRREPFRRRAASSCHRAVQFLAAGLVQILQLGLAPHQVHFDLRRDCCAPASTLTRSCFNSSSAAASVSRMRASSAASC